MMNAIWRNQLNRTFFLHLCVMFYFGNLALYFLFRGRGGFAGHRLGYLVIPVYEKVQA